MKDESYQLEAVLFLVEILLENQKHARDNAFGNGFYRWVSTADIKRHIMATRGTLRDFSQVRRTYDRLEKDGLCESKKRSGAYNCYSLKTWIDHTAINDYFVKTDTIK